ncbi:MAG: sugar transferase [Candidatus Limiplasma sp.]|nr:sugar transferase [Candidatus Limiplasma sp.]
MSRQYIQSQLMKTVFQFLLYVSLFLTFFLLLSTNNPQIINMSRTAATTMATFAIVLAILTYVYGGYQLGVRKARSVFSSILIAIVLTDIATYLQLQIMNVNPANNDRLILFGEDFWLLCAAVVLQVGLIYLFVSLGYHFYFTINPPQKCCVIASSQEQAEHIAQKMGTFRQKYRLNDVLHYACADVRQTILHHDVVFLAGIPDTEEAELKSFCYKNGKTIYLQAELEDVIVSTSQQNVIDDTLFLYIHRVEPTLLQRFVKRLSDIVLSVVGLLVASPLMLFSALLIFFSHNGPIFFRQDRATIGGRVFQIIKFRTMYQDACDAAGKSACENDDRITPVGRFLRKYRLDELPQLLNVLAGDMSIVGPRPEMMENVHRYTREVPEFEYRKQMKAGLTGMAQIDGKYNTTPRDKVMLDLLYIENFSLMLDAKLILRTATIFFRRDSTEGFQSERHAVCPALRTQTRYDVDPLETGADELPLDGEDVELRSEPEPTAEAPAAAAPAPSVPADFTPELSAPEEAEIVHENEPMETLLDITLLAQEPAPETAAPDTEPSPDGEPCTDTDCEACIAGTQPEPTDGEPAASAAEPPPAETPEPTAAAQS